MTAPMFVMGGGRNETRLQQTMKRRPLGWVAAALSFVVLLVAAWPLGLIAGPLALLGSLVVGVLVGKSFARWDKALGLLIGWHRISRDIGLLTGSGRPFRLDLAAPIAVKPRGYMVRVLRNGGLTVDKAEACAPGLAAEMGLPVYEVWDSESRSIVFALMEDGTK